MSIKIGTLVSAGAAALVLILLLATALYVLLPQRLAGAFAEAVERETGLGLAVNGPATFSFANGFAANFADVRIASSNLTGGLQIEAKHLRLPMDLSNVTGDLQGLPPVTADEAMVTLDLGGALHQGQSGAGKASLEGTAVAPSLLRVRIANSTFTLADSRTGFEARLKDASGLIDRNAAGELRLHLSGLFNGIHSTIHLEADNAGRIAAGGSPADLVLSSDKGELQFSGRLAWEEGLALDGRLFAASRNAAGFMAWLGLPSAMAPQTAVELEGGFSSAKAEARLAAFTLTHESTTVTGQLSLAREQDGLAIDGKLQTPELQLAAFWRKPGAREEWSSTTMGWLPLPEIRGRLEINAKVLMVQKWRLEGAQALFEFAGRTAELSATANAGAIELSLSAAGATTPDVRFRLKLDNANAAEVLPSLAGYSWLAGAMDLEVDANAKGGNLASLIATFSGKFSMDLQRGELSGYSLKDLLADAGKGWRSAPGDASHGLAVAAHGNIADGIFVLQPTRLKADDLDIGVSGEIDLLRQAVDLHLEANGGGELPAKLGVSGSWYDPDFGAATAQSGEPPVPAPSAN